MSDEQLFELIDSCLYDDASPQIGLSGGEAFLYFDRLRRIIQYIVGKGGRVAVNTNCFWGVTVAKAAEMLRLLRDDGIDKLVASYDDYHQEYIKPERVINVIVAGKIVHVEVELQFVASRESTRLHQFMQRYADELLNITCREIPLHPVGRAAAVPPEALFLSDAVPLGLCPSSILSVSAYGKFIPCCNTAGHLPALELGEVRRDSLPEVHQAFLSNPLFKLLREYGPQALLTAARDLEEFTPEKGYIDQCHLCYVLFKNPAVARKLSEQAAEIYYAREFDRVLAHFESLLSAEQPMPTA